MNPRYKNIPVQVDQNLRPQVDRNILLSISARNEQITPAQMLACYTGKGKQHGFRQGDFDNYHEYAEAKKEFEAGQFFTPYEVAEKIVKALKPEGTVLDPTAGAGVFCNFVQEDEFTGVEVDDDALSVAKYLYPDAKWVRHDVRYWQAKEKFDFVITNPPFNLRWDDETSQDFILKASINLWLKDFGIFAAVVPEKWLQDELYYKSVISELNEKCNWIGQVKLGRTVFKNYDLNFETKVIFWQKREGGSSFSPEFNTWFDIAQRLGEARRVRKENILKVMRSVESDNDYAFSNPLREKNGGYGFQMRKLLFEIKTHPATKKNLPKATALIEKYRNQKPPYGLDWKEWDKIRLTEGRVLARLRGYAGKKKKSKVRPRSKPADPLQVTAFKNIVVGKQEIKFLEEFTFKDQDGKHSLTDIQKGDIGKILMKRYGFLNWEQGCGKTVASYAVTKFRKAKLNIILAPALAINETWVKFLEGNGEQFKVIKKRSDLDLSINYWLFTFNSLGGKQKIYKILRRYLRQVNNNVQLIVDESDELSSRSSRRYKSARAAFSHCRYKLLMTGTATRNNAAELYPQLELLYNNSRNLVDDCVFNWVLDTKKNELKKKINQNRYNTFSGYRGYQQFKRCFSPAKATVFGIKKHNQDVFNYTELLKILNYTTILRRFEDIAGDKYQIKNIVLKPSWEEISLYEKILETFHEMCYKYFRNTGNHRKESYLQIIRQIQLMIRAASHPESFEEYTGKGSSKRSAIVEKIKTLEKQKVCLGSTTVKEANSYFLTAKKVFPDRPLFYIDGSISFKKRGEIINEFEATKDGILVCTQQSLKSSVNIPTCNHCILTSLQWNYPKMSQFFFRFIRFNSKELTTVYFVNLADTIESNLMALIMAKEKINRAVKLNNQDRNEVFEDIGFDINILNSVLERTYDKESKQMRVQWGNQKLVS